MNVGKTCLLKRYINNTFNEGEDATLGATFYSKKLKAEFQIKEKNDDSKSSASASSRPQSVQLPPLQYEDIKLQLWDTAGEERFRAVTPLYYKDAQAILVCFSLTSMESFENIDKWLKDIDGAC